MPGNNKNSGKAFAASQAPPGFKGASQIPQLTPNKIRRTRRIKAAAAAS
jgi:hypothetical protein